MTKQQVQSVSIQSVLTNVCEELFALSQRLQEFERIIFDPKGATDPIHDLEGMQDMDLIIQQIADLARAIGCITEVELGDANVASAALDDRMHLGDLRQRLLGLSEQQLLVGGEASQEVLLF